MTEQNKKIKELVEKGLSYRAIGDALGLTRNAVKSRAIRMRLVHPNRPEQNGKIGSGSSLKGETEMAQAPTQAQLSAFREHCEAYGLPFENWRGFWHKTQEYSSFFTNKEGFEHDAKALEKLRLDTIAQMQKHAPKYQKPKPIKGETLLVLPRADDHFGKLSTVEETGYEYNLKVASERSAEGTASLLAMAEPFKPKAFAVCIGNDAIHIDTHKRTSTAGTPQDTDGTIFTMFDAAKLSYITMIEHLAEKGDVYLFFVPSNHDWLAGRFLADSVGSWFHKHPNVHLGGDSWWNLKTSHRKYMKFGENLIMFSHGDGFKERDGRSIMADEAKEAWATTTFRYIYLGHVHHKDRKAQSQIDKRLEKDFIGFTEINTSVTRDPLREVYVEYVRSQSPADGWHSRNAFLNMPCVEAFIHHQSHGQMARLSHFF